MYLVPLFKCNDIAFTLHLRGGVKGSIVISLYLGFPHVLYICTPMGLNTKYPFSLFSFITRTTVDLVIFVLFWNKKVVMCTPLSYLNDFSNYRTDSLVVPGTQYNNWVSDEWTRVSLYYISNSSIHC